jgi:hypothetical protein
MTSRIRFAILGTATLLLIGAVSVVMAQTPGTGRGASPMYDVKTETTIKGTVESVETVNWGRWSRPSSPRRDSPHGEDR